MGWGHGVVLYTQLSCILKIRYLLLKFLIYQQREVSRKDILKQAEKVMEDMGNSTNARTMLEIHYENEVSLFSLLLNLNL